MDASADAAVQDNTEQTRQLALLVDSVVDYAIFLLDSSGTIASWNPGAERIKGYRPAEAIGRHFSMFYTDEDRAREHPRHALETARREGRFAEENWRVRQDGTRFWASVTITPLRNADGRLEGFAKVTRDLTERRRAEQELLAARERLAASNAELQRFATVAAHDLTEPLRTLGGFAGLLESRYRAALPAEAGELLDHIETSVERMQDLIDSLLEYARAGARRDDGEPASTAPADVVAALLLDVTAAIEERQAKVTLAVDADHRVAADPRDVAMVLRNLLSNALKFADVHRPRVVVSSERRAHDTVRIVVQDNGIGIATDKQEAVFRPFQRLHGQSEYPGSGLGLAICRRIVARCGGTIGIDSVPGDGARVWFELPAA